MPLIDSWQRTDTTTNILERETMRKQYMQYVIGFAAGAILTGLATAELVLNAQDAVTRTQVQYADCKAVGDYPTAADMLPGDTGQ
jgi:hypothetical protein